MAEKLAVWLLDLGTLYAKQESIVCRDQPENTNRIHLPVMAVLVRHESGFLLFDTGCRPDAMEGGWPQNMQAAFPLTRSPQQDLTHQLALCGVSPEQIGTVVLSHLHLDHAGNVSLFPHARCIVPAEDLALARSLVKEEDPARRGGYIRRDIEELPEDLIGLTQDETLFPGVRLLSLPGHTPGLLGMAVSSSGETLLFPSDAVYTADNYGPPPVSPRSPYNREQLLQSVSRVRELADTLGARVIFSHDINLWGRLPHAPLAVLGE